MTKRIVIVIIIIIWPIGDFFFEDTFVRECCVLYDHWVQHGTKNVGL